MRGGGRAAGGMGRGVGGARGAGGGTSRTTRTTNRGGGSVTHEGVLRAAGGGGSGRGGGAVVRVAAAAGAAPERAASRRRGGWVPRLHAGLRRGAGRSHRVLRLRVPLLRFVRDGADAGDPRTVARHGQGAVVLARLPAARAPVRALRRARRAVRG